MRFNRIYSKLYNLVFITIRKNARYHEIGKTYNMTGEVDFSAEIIATRPIRKKDITENIARADADCSKKKLIEKLENWYGKDFDNYVLIVLAKEQRQIRRK